MSFARKDLRQTGHFLLDSSVESHITKQETLWAMELEMMEYYVHKKTQ